MLVGVCLIKDAPVSTFSTTSGHEYILIKGRAPPVTMGHSRWQNENFIDNIDKKPNSNRCNGIKKTICGSDHRMAQNYSVA